MYLFPLVKFEFKKKFFLISTIILLITILTENVIVQNQNFDSISTGVSALVVMIYSIMHLFSRVNEDSKIGAFRIDTSFLITTSFLFYFSGTFFIYLLSKYYFLDTKFQSSYSLINGLVILIRNLIITASFIVGLDLSFLKNKVNTSSIL